MRAGLFLEVLAGLYQEVYLLVIPVAPGAHAASQEFVHSLASVVVLLDPATTLDPLLEVMSRIQDPAARTRMLQSYPRPVQARFTHAASIAKAAGRFSDVDFAVVHVMRTYLADYASPWLRRRDLVGKPLCVLDADECESRTKRSLAVLHAQRGDSRAAEHESGEAEKYELIENQMLSKFDRVLVASAVDAAALYPRVRAASVRIVPNGIRERQPIRDTFQEQGDSRRTSQERAPFTLLFVGTLDYLPNEDGCHFFCREILPELQNRTSRETRLLIVGAGSTAAIRELHGRNGVTVVGQVRDVSSSYERADVAIVPLRAGGGTRIKILEAFAHGVPVVTTTIGAEGLEVANGVHALIADDAPSFAEACARLAGEPALGEELRVRALEWVRQHHSAEVVRVTARQVFKTP